MRGFIVNRPGRHATHGDDDNIATLDEYVRSARRLADIVRRALDHPGTVNRGAMRRALETFERTDYRAL